MSQNLQQIFHPHRQSHSRSINNLSAVGAVGTAKNPSKPALKVPQSLPQSPRILVDSSTSPFFPSLQIPSLNFFPPSQPVNPVYPTFNFNQPVLRITEATNKFKGFKLGEFRKNQYTRTTSTELPNLPKPLVKRFSWEDRRRSSLQDRFKINDVVKENSELLRKYSDPKLQPFQESGSSSLTMLQSAFKAKLASLFRNKKKYTIAEPPSSRRENSNGYILHRCDSCQSLPAMIENKKNQKQRAEKKGRKGCKLMKTLSTGRCRTEGKLKSLNLNPPHMIGGSFDNLLLVNRMNQKRIMMMGTYDTYHGKPLLSQSSRLKALYKYRKPSESDDATTLSYDYDSGDMSDTSSIAQSSSDVGEDSSSYSDLTTKSSNCGYKIRSSASVNSMPQIKVSRKARVSVTAAHSPNRSLEAPQFQFPMNFKSSEVSGGNRVVYPPFPSKSLPYHLTHQMSAPALNNRSDSLTMPLMSQQPSLGHFTKPNYYPSLSMPSPSVHINQNPNQRIKAFFTHGPASSNEFPLVSLSHSLKN